MEKEQHQKSGKISIKCDYLKLFFCHWLWSNVFFFSALTEEILKKSPNLHIEKFRQSADCRNCSQLLGCIFTNEHISTDVLFKGLLLFSRSAMYLLYLRTWADISIPPFVISKIVLFFQATFGPCPQFRLIGEHQRISSVFLKWYLGVFFYFHGKLCQWAQLDFALAHTGISSVVLFLISKIVPSLSL